MCSKHDCFSYKDCKKEEKCLSLFQCSVYSKAFVEHIYVPRVLCLNPNPITCNPNLTLPPPSPQQYMSYSANTEQGEIFFRFPLCVIQSWGAQNIRTQDAGNEWNDPLFVGFEMQLGWKLGIELFSMDRALSISFISVRNSRSMMSGLSLKSHSMLVVETNQLNIG